jgi:ring-1,2-phenylacetyl-CoA epoxidase subunit PaaE
MGLFNFRKEKKSAKSAVLTVSKHEKLTPNSARITFEVPADLKPQFAFRAGQYLNLHCLCGSEELIRSYSICSGENEDLSVAVKAINNGKASNFLVNELKAGEKIEVDFPQGNFGIKPGKKHVAFAAGSGITPILSMAKALEQTDGQLTLFYGNASRESTYFATDLDQLTKTTTHYFYSQEEVEGHHNGRLDKHNVSEIIKKDLSLLRAEAFYICGPEAMIVAIREVLHVFGVSDDHIHFELFTPPVLLAPEPTEVTAGFEGESTVTAMLDGEMKTIKLATNGKSILEAFDKAGMDVPYSCRGGVCCTCKAKIIEGSANMHINYALTDDEVKQGYILTCQSHPTSEVLKIDYDA